MAGSWEIAPEVYTPREVLMVILTREIVHVNWALGLRNIVLPESSGIATLAGMPFDHARNVGCQKMLENNFEHLMFLDDDIIPPHDVYYRLKQHNTPVVSGLYYRRALPIVPCMMRDNKESGLPDWVANYPENSLIDVDLVGAGCLLIKRCVLENMNKNWFEWKVDREDLPIKERISEDYSFCRRAKKLGYQIKVDTSIQCRHIGSAESSKTGFEVIKY